MGSGAPRVTVGIPTFNRSGWLRETIACVLAQTYTDFRLVVSDNASTDDTPEVVRAFGDPRIAYVRSARNIGAIGNLNRLIGLAQTEFLVLLPDDDLIYPRHLEASIAALDRFPTAGLVHSAFDLLDAHSQLLKPMRPVETVNPLRARSQALREPRARALRRMMVAHWPMCFASVVYRTEAIVAAGGIPEDAGPFADMQLWMRIAQHADYAYLPQRLAGFRLHDQSVSVSVASKAEAGELASAHSQMRHEQRTAFLDRARPDSREAARLRALAELTFLIERAPSGLTARETAACLAGISRLWPRILLRPALWRLVVAQLGGRRLRAAFRDSRRVRRQLAQRGPT
jgi:hypothetical protein